jgi:hypothetical protein
VSESLFHYGILGMRWGVRRSREQLGYSKRPNEKTPSGQERPALKSQNKFKRLFQKT